MTQGVNFDANGVIVRSPYWGIDGNIFLKETVYGSSKKSEEYP